MDEWCYFSDIHKYMVNLLYLSNMSSWHKSTHKSHCYCVPCHQMSLYHLMTSTFCPTLVGVKVIIHDTITKAFDGLIKPNRILMTSLTCTTIVEVRKMIHDTVLMVSLLPMSKLCCWSSVFFVFFVSDVYIMTWSFTCMLFYAINSKQKIDSWQLTEAYENKAILLFWYNIKL